MVSQREREPFRARLRRWRVRCAAMPRHQYRPRNTVAPQASPDELIRPRASLRAWTRRTRRRKSAHKGRLFGSSHSGLSGKQCIPGGRCWEKEFFFWHEADMTTLLGDVRFRGNSGHSGEGASMSAFDPKRTMDCFPRALWMIASAGHRYCLHRKLRRSATGQQGRKMLWATDKRRIGSMNPLRTTVLMKTDISGSTSRFRELLAADLQAL